MLMPRAAALKQSGSDTVNIVVTCKRVIEMAEQSSKGGGLYFIVGALVVAVAVLGYFVIAGGSGSDTKEIKLKVETPKT